MVVCVGYCTLDTILAVPRHPEPDERVVASELVLAGGGPAATAAVTLARLGVPVAFIGAIGDDDAGLVIKDSLEREGVDLSELRVEPGARSARSTILVSGETRTIVSFPGSVPRPVLSARGRELCRSAEWVHVDHWGYGAAAGRLSVDGGNPIPDLDLRGVALYAPTERSLVGSAEDALDAGAELVVVTCGSRGSYAVTKERERIDAPAYPVDVVSTLGAGDVFHGALLASLVEGAPLADALARANRSAALSCRALDGRSAIPTAAELWATA